VSLIVLTLQLLSYASAGAAGVILHALVFLLRPEDFFTIGESDAHPLADCVKAGIFSKRRWGEGLAPARSRCRRRCVAPGPRVISFVAESAARLLLKIDV
jgi:hypothetical protein